MNTDTQQLTIIILGVMGIASIIMQHEQALLIIIGIIGGFLTNKTMTEKQSETLEKYQLNKAVSNDPEIIAGSIGFDTKEEMDEYLQNHTLDDMITDASNGEE